MTMVREQESFVSRRSFLTTVSALLVGTAGPLGLSALAAAPAIAGPSGDAVLIEAWSKFQEAMTHNDLLNEQIKPLSDAALESIPPHMEREQFLSLTKEEQQTYRDQRSHLYVEAFDKHGVTAALKEQDHFLETVADPLAETIRNTTPTSVKGVAIKTAYLRDYTPREDLWGFIDQLADLS